MVRIKGRLFEDVRIYRGTALKTPPFFSVIIPTYNRAERVQVAIDSVLTQTFRDYELIVVDDGSTDDTPIRLSQQYAKMDLKYIYQRNRGKPGARNTGIKFARGEYVAFLDSDDRWKPNKLERQAAFIQDHGNVAVLYGPVEIVDESGKLLEKATRQTRKDFQRQHRRGEAYEVFCHQCLLFSTNLVIRRDLLEKAGGYDEAVLHLEDVDLYLRLVLKYFFYYLDEPLAEHSHYHENTQGRDHCQGVIAVAEKHLREIRQGICKPDRPRLAESRLYVRIAESWYILDNFAGMRSAVSRVVRLRPTELLKGKVMLHFLMSYLPRSWLALIRNRNGWRALLGGDRESRGLQVNCICHASVDGKKRYGKN